MIKFACNHSPELMRLIVSGEVSVDFIKAGAFGAFIGELPKMRALRPVLLHGLGNNERAGMPGYRELDFGRMNALLLRYGSPHYGIHLAMTNADAGGFIPGGEAEKRMTECAGYFRERIRVPLLLENIADSPDERVNFDMVPFAEPDRISRVIHGAGAGLLLDIAHAKVASFYRGWDLRAYLMELPLHKAGEVHVSGYGYDAAGEPYDAHGPLTEEDYGDLEWVLGHTRPGIVTLEYGWPEADAGILREQIRRMRDMIKGR